MTIGNTVTIQGHQYSYAALLATDEDTPGYFSHTTLLEILAGSYLNAICTGISRYCGRMLRGAIVLLPTGWPNSKAIALDPHGLLRETGLPWPPPRRAQKFSSHTPILKRSDKAMDTFLILEPLPRLINVGPVRIWMAKCADGFTSDLRAFFADPAFDPQSSTGADDLQDYAETAIFQHFRPWKSNLLDRVRFSEILRLSRALQMQREEGSPVRGSLLISWKDRPRTTIPLSASPSSLTISDHKLVGKLMLASPPGMCLVTSGTSILGYGHARLSKKQGFMLEFRPREVGLAWRGVPLCVMRNGTLEGVDLMGDSASLIDAIRKTNSRISQDVVAALVDVATKALIDGRGCTLILGSTRDVDIPSGLRLDTPMQIRSQNGRAAAVQMSKLDGAVAVGTRGQLLGFGWLLDGKARPSQEQRSRGARHNSAIRFTAARKGVVAIVTSVDGGASVFHRGKQVYPLARFAPDEADMPSITPERVAVKRLEWT